MIDMLKGYVQLASGVSQLTRRRALELAKQLLEATPAAGAFPAAASGAEMLSLRASALADELLQVSKQNRALLLELVRAEVETVVTRLGLSGTAEMEAALASSRARVVELERELARRDVDASSGGRARTPARRASTTATAKQTTAKQTTAKQATAKKTTAKKTTAKKTTAKKTTAKQAARATAKRAAGSAGGASQ